MPQEKRFVLVASFSSAENRDEFAEKLQTLFEDNGVPLEWYLHFKAGSVSWYPIWHWRWWADAIRAPLSRGIWSDIERYKLTDRKIDMLRRHS